MSGFDEMKNIHNKEQQFWSRMARQDFNVDPCFIQTVIENDLFCRMLGEFSQNWAIDYVSTELNNQYADRQSHIPLNCFSLYTSRESPEIYQRSTNRFKRAIDSLSFWNRNTLTDIVEINTEINRPHDYRSYTIYVKVLTMGLVNFDMFSVAHNIQRLMGKTGCGPKEMAKAIGPHLL